MTRKSPGHMCLAASILLADRIKIIVETKKKYCRVKLLLTGKQLVIENTINILPESSNTQVDEVVHVVYDLLTDVFIALVQVLQTRQLAVTYL